MSEKKLHYGVRLRVDQLKYLKKIQNRSEWIRKAIDEKRKREEKRKSKSKWLHEFFYPLFLVKNPLLAVSGDIPRKLPFFALPNFFIQKMIVMFALYQRI